MSQEHLHQTTDRTATSQHTGHKGHHRWMMVACCIPMVIIVAVLIATGAISIGWLLFAATCVAMMTLMMGGMNHGGKHE